MRTRVAVREAVKGWLGRQVDAMERRYCERFIEERGWMAERSRTAVCLDRRESPCQRPGHMPRLED